MLSISHINLKVHHSVHAVSQKYHAMDGLRPVRRHLNVFHRAIMLTDSYLSIINVLKITLSKAQHPIFAFKVIGQVMYQIVNQDAVLKQLLVFQLLRQVVS